jgi:Flp pilus assembly protein TadD
MKSMRENLEALLAKGRDNALLRFTLGELCLKAGDLANAVTHLSKALELDPHYSAAWKLYGRVLTETGQREAAVAAYTQGIATAEAKGDRQAAREMGVFLRRLQRKS